MTVDNIIEDAIKNSNDELVNLTRTVAYATQQTYVNAMNELFKEVATGKNDYYTAFKKITNELAEKGVTLTRKDGAKEKLEVATRRGLFGSLHQTANDIAKKIGEDIDYNCVVIGHSSTCRSTHNVIDDVVMSKKEFEKYEYLTEEYGCNHIVNYDWREEFENIDDKIEYGEQHQSLEECTKNYEIQQKMRYYERQIRAKKSAIESGNTSEEAKQQLKLAQIKYKTYCSINKTETKYKRTWIPKSNKQGSTAVKSSYKDITKKWLNNSKPNSHKVKDRKYFEHSGTKYKVDNKNVVLDYSKHEYEVAEWLESTLGGEIYMIPRVNKPDGIKTADYLWNNEYWDLKDINGSGKNILFHAIEDHEQQAHNFIFDISNSNLTKKEVLERLDKLYSLKRISWLNKIIIKKDNNAVIIAKKNSPSD